MSFTLHQNLALLTVAEDAAWEEILQQSRMQRHLITVLSPRAVVLEPEAVEPLVAWLRKHGHLPQIINPPQT